MLAKQSTAELHPWHPHLGFCFTYICVFGEGCITHVETRGNSVGLSSLLPQCGLHHQSWCKSLYPKPSHCCNLRFDEQDIPIHCGERGGAFHQGNCNLTDTSTISRSFEFLYLGDNQAALLFGSPSVIGSTDTDYNGIVSLLYNWGQGLCLEPRAFTRISGYFHAQSNGKYVIAMAMLE